MFTFSMYSLFPFARTSLTTEIPKGLGRRGALVAKTPRERTSKNGMRRKVPFLDK